VFFDLPGLHPVLGDTLWSEFLAQDAKIPTENLGGGEKKMTPEQHGESTNADGC